MHNFPKIIVEGVLILRSGGAVRDPLAIVPPYAQIHDFLPKLSQKPVWWRHSAASFLPVNHQWCDAKEILGKCYLWPLHSVFFGRSLPSSSALIPMSICALQCLFSHSFTTYEWLNRDCDVQIYIGITSRWTGYIFGHLEEMKIQFWTLKKFICSITDVYLYIAISI
jgi:hypothetical protein